MTWTNSGGRAFPCGATPMEPSEPPAPNARPTGSTNGNDASASRSPTDRPSSSATTVDGREVCGPITPEIERFLERRGLDMEIAARLGVGASRRHSGDWLAIPYRQNGATINHKYRRLSEKAWMQDTGAPRIFWNVDCLTDETLDADPLLITEGEFDAMAALQCGYARTVSCPDGAPAEQVKDGAKKYAFLDNAPRLGAAKEIIICADGDDPGANLLHDLSIRLGRYRCKWVRYPRGCKDLNDALHKYGERGVHETIKRAMWVSTDGVYHLRDVTPAPEPQPHEIGIIGMARHYRVRLGDVCIVTGIPSHGKSTFINEVCYRMAERYGWVVGFASFEQRRQDHERNLRTLHNGKWVKYQTPEEISAADKFIHRHFAFIMPGEDDDVTLTWVLERAAIAAVQFGARIIVIDPWNEMDHDRPNEMSLTEYTGFAIKQFRKFARKHNVHLIIAAHPAKMRKNDDGNYGVPTLYDISDSAHWYNKADVGIVIHRTGRTPQDSKTLIRVSKTRYHDQIGEPGDMEAVFNPQSLRYTLTDIEQAAA